MTEKMEHFDEDSSLKVSPRLSADLEGLFKPQVQVPPEVDRAILDRAGEHFAGLEPGKDRRRLLHWRHLWRVAAAAAVIIFAFSLDLTKKQQPPAGRSVRSESRAVDIDRNGRVDILDAFKLARQIESTTTAEESYDVNGDGLVNRGDVDFIAFAAVRLDKGVL
ncbi:MAG: dockerin type I domain-containing protein [Planctomycetota bacterium]